MPDPTGALMNMRAFSSFWIRRNGKRNNRVGRLRDAYRGTRAVLVMTA